MTGVTISAAVLWWGLVAVVLIALLLGWAYQIAHRLDRLHIRTDHAWMALDGALDRRAAAARMVAACPACADPVALRHAVDAASGAPRGHREEAENRLHHELARTSEDALEPMVREALADARARVSIARSFYNDAVRDTRALRTRPVVRLFRLAGTAPLPRFFEIAVEPS